MFPADLPSDSISGYFDIIGAVIIQDDATNAEFLIVGATTPAQGIPPGSFANILPTNPHFANHLSVIPGSTGPQTDVLDRVRLLQLLEPNAEMFIHPVFGNIVMIRAIRFITPGEEILLRWPDALWEKEWLVRTDQVSVSSLRSPARPLSSPYSQSSSTASSSQSYSGSLTPSSTPYQQPYARLCFWQTINSKVVDLHIFLIQVKFAQHVFKRFLYHSSRQLMDVIIRKTRCGTKNTIARPFYTLPSDEHNVFFIPT